jgi:preprotein translocase subunit SecA
MRIFAGDRVKNLMDRMGMPDDEPIEHPWVTKSIENAQRKVEERNFDIRKHLLEYDDVMNAQRKTVYSVRQQLLLGRYAPEELDELGKPTGRNREIAVDEQIRERVTPLIAQLVGMYSNPLVAPRDDEGRSRPPTREELSSASELAELEQLQREVYHLWGIRIDAERRRSVAPTEIYDELIESVCHGLSEQRERLFDLIDRVVAAMVEECCPAERPPEDWDVVSVQDGFRESFGIKIEAAIDQMGEPHRVVRNLYQTAEQTYWDREREMGVDLALRVFRYLYLETIDEAWVDHLTNMEHLRDGIGLRGYGQRDPKNEYKKEGYSLFVNMMARVSSTVLTKFFNVQIQKQDEMRELEAAAEARHHAELDHAIAKHVGEEGELSPEELLAQVRNIANGGVSTRPAQQRAASRIGRNDLCPCGSGKKFKHCHGSADDEPVEAEP